MDQKSSHTRQNLDAIKQLGGTFDSISQVLNALTLPTILTDRKYGQGFPTVLLVNSAFEDMCGYKADEICGLTPKVLQGPETDIESARKFRWEVESTGSGVVDLVNYRKDGSPYEVMLFGGRIDPPPDANGDERGFLVTFAFHFGNAELCLPMSFLEDPI